MGKQRKTPEQAPREPSKSAGPAHGVDPSLAEREGLGNAEIQARIAGGGVESTVASLDVVRDTALPLVGRAILALQMVARGDELERFVAIVEKSNLPADRKDQIVDRLRSDEAVATSIGDAVAKWFGADGPSVRDGIFHDLGAIEAAMLGGAEVDGTWRVADRDVALSNDARDGGLPGRADAFVGDIARATVQTAPEAVRGFCHDVHLALMWMDEEEEELNDPVAPEII